MNISWRSFMRTKESGGRPSRTLKLDDSSAQLQGKEARLAGGPRFLQVRWWTEESDAWTPLVIDPTKTGLDAIAAAGTGKHEPDSWEQARAAFKASRNIEL